MLLISISDPPQEGISFDGDTFEGPIFDVPQECGELLMVRPDLWRPATEDESLEHTKKTAAHKPPAKTASPAKKTAAHKPA